MGWQALQVTDYKDPHYPAVCLITEGRRFKSYPRYQISRKPLIYNNIYYNRAIRYGPERLPRDLERWYH